MANLIIKPSTGGQLILKDEGDSAAITVATNGAVTIAGNVTLSGAGNVYGVGTFPTGHIVQVVQTVKTDFFTSTAINNNFVAITGLTCEITPARTSNKILVNVSVNYGTSVYAGFLKIQHNGSGSYADVSGAVGTANGSMTPMTMGNLGGTADSAETMNSAVTFLDSPSKDSAFTYRIMGSARHDTTWYINSPQDRTDQSYTGLGISTITLMEVSA